MIYAEYTKIVSSAVHIVGNKSLDEGLFLAENSLSLDAQTEATLIDYLLSSFKDDCYYQLWHETDLKLNEIYYYAQNIFKNNDSFQEQSKAIAKHLYEHSIHPKIKKGELCVVLLKNIILETTTCNALGIFKSESKDTFLQIKTEKGCTLMHRETGININRLNKGCIIFNMGEKTGYVVSVVDHINRKGDSKYWTDYFLKVKPIPNNYFKTDSLLTITQEYIAQLPESEFKIDKINYVNRSQQLSENAMVSIADYAHSVFQSVEKESHFKAYIEKKTSELGVWLDDAFEVSDIAVKKKKSSSLTAIKLDKNFDVSIHGGEQFIERGYDKKKGLKYYKFFFKEEK